MDYELIQTQASYAILTYGRERLSVARRKDARSGQSPSA